MSKSFITKVDKLDRTRLAKNFFLRDFLYSETAVVGGIENTLDDSSLAVEASSKLCKTVLEPFQGVWGGFRMSSVFKYQENQLGCNPDRMEQKSIIKSGIKRTYFKALPPSQCYTICESKLNINRYS
ncbi:MAG: hypothetical protein CBB67_017245 [Alteromonadaceae bacterium TMED7]|nr:MAG: hypothetical protein CBB67_017245 [Alteromonadaceae bacterium TMED7]|tara:strand:- start:19573 stop:19953 length:381 start_codon:yes stop_codon:yes gene_type:complete